MQRGAPLPKFILNAQEQENPQGHPAKTAQTLALRLRIALACKAHYRPASALEPAHDATHASRSC
jgi:hypothetical protein